MKKMIFILKSNMLTAAQLGNTENHKGKNPP